MENQPVTLQDVLDARERRAQLQQKLIEMYRIPVISFTMNIAGPVKTNPQILRAFESGRSVLENDLKEKKLPVKERCVIHEATGDEALYAVDGDPQVLKDICVSIEEGMMAGRLYDMDVIGADGIKLVRETERSCIVCGRQGRYCASRRIHSAEEVQAAAERLICLQYLAGDAERMGELCVQCLIDEAETTPKPGLVDRRNNGSHTDMDLPLLIKSAKALKAYFNTCFRNGYEHKGSAAQELFPVLQEAGKKAEKTMFETTGGVNTHKGAVFHMGLICGAAGYLYRGVLKYDIDELCETVRAVCSPGLEEHFASLSEKEPAAAGEELYLRYGMKGARGEAMSGYASVRNYALPVYRMQYRETADPEYAGCRSLLALIAQTEDTNMIRRGGIEKACKAAAEMREKLSSGRITIPEIQRIDDAYIKDHLSPGGSADLLAVTYLLNRLDEDGYE